MDRDLHAWLGGPMERLPEAALQATFAVTARTRQRSWLAAVVAGTPTMRGAAGKLPITRPILVAAALLLALAAALFIAGQFFQDRRLVVAPTSSPSSTVPSGGPPSGPPTSEGPEATPDLTTVFLVPGSTVLFSSPLTGDWRLARDDEPADGGIRIDARTEIGPGFDPIPVAWVTIRATTEPIETLEASMGAEGWTGPREAIDVPGLSGVILTSPAGSTLDPTALVEFAGATYRILGHDNNGASESRAILVTFLRRFNPLGPAPPQDVYVDAVWGFSFASAAAHGQFLAGADLGSGVTRFADVDCGPGNEGTCDRFVDVVRLPNVSPLHLHLPDGRDVDLKIYTKSAEYVRLAAEWEARVGTSRGSSAYYWLGTIVYDVDNVAIQARFIHRGDQWLVVLSSETPGADSRRIDSFLAGFTLLTPQPAPTSTP